MDKKSVTIVGVGALGSHLVQFMRNLPVSTKIIDFDRVDAKNVQSQFHTKLGVGKSKVQALKGQMTMLYGINVEAVPHKLVADNVQQLLGSKVDIVVDCLDNGEGRRLVQQHAREKKIPCLHGALAAGGAFGRVVWDEKFKIEDAPIGAAATCEDGEHLPFIVVVAGLLARAVQEFLVRGSRIGFEVNAGGVIRT